MKLAVYGSRVCKRKGTVLAQAYSQCRLDAAIGSRAWVVYNAREEKSRYASCSFNEQMFRIASSVGLPRTLISHLILLGKLSKVLRQTYR
jgi:hypothetical protein